MEGLTTSGVEVAERLESALASVVHLEPSRARALLCALFAGGHALIEGVPGVAKTLLARTLARCIDGEFRRIQFTNDLLPADVVGGMVWRPSREVFEFLPGPLFAQVVLADEINRTSPRTLSCLLEAMENGRVSVERTRHTLPAPFCVIATRNPIEFHGTFPVPEAALDRFLVRIPIDYPDEEAELALYQGEDKERVLDRLAPVLPCQELVVHQSLIAAIPVSEPIARYTHRLVRRTRDHVGVALGISPRGALSLLRLARANAHLSGRDYLLPDDVQSMFVPALSHRLVLDGHGDAVRILAEILAETDVSL